MCLYVVLDQAAFKLQDTILDYYHAVPKPRGWSEDLAAKRSYVRKLFKKAKRNNRSWHEYHETCTKYKKSIRKAKFIFWKVSYSEIDSS